MTTNSKPLPHKFTIGQQVFLVDEVVEIIDYNERDKHGLRYHVRSRFGSVWVAESELYEILL